MAAKSKGSEWSSVVKTKRRELPRHATAHDASGESPTRTFVAYGTVPLDEKDAFGHRDYATAVARLLLNESPPFTLGVFGDWGLGKTTILEEVGRQVTAAGSAFAIFDVWRYEGDALRRQFLRDVASQLKRNGFLRRQYDPERALRN